VWRHGGVGAGRVSQETLSSPNRLQAWINSTRRTVEWERDGVESGVALAYDSRGYSFVVNGKADGSARGDAGTQVMLGLLGALNHASPKSSLVIGLGTGSTAGWLGVIPSMTRVDVVELEPVVLDVARASKAVNQNVLDNPKVHVTIGDARETLLTSTRRYDVIASEPSNPYRAGVAGLFTQEYYRAASDRLTDDGVFAQWVQAYEIDVRTLRTIYATLASVFPSIESWQTTGNDLVLIAAKRARSVDVATLSARIAQEPYRTALANVWRVQTVEDVVAHRVAGPAIADAIAHSRGADINTDDRNVVEFGLARSVGRSGLLMVPALREIARTLDPNGAARGSAGVSTVRVDTAAVAFNAAEGWPAEGQPQDPPVERARQAALRLYFEQNNLAAARAAWQQLADQPRNLTELAMVADLEADAGSEDAMPCIDELRKYQPAEADVLLAAFHLKRGEFDGAATAIESAIVRLRTDPWPMQRYKEKALSIADAIALHSQLEAGRMFEALRKPFALRALDDGRLQLAAALTRRIDFPRLCRGPIGALDAYPPWTGPFLQLRMDCYRETNDARLTRATRDLDAFLSAEMPRSSSLDDHEPRRLEGAKIGWLRVFVPSWCVSLFWCVRV
jgi:spermidine synthase/tetratricopeptide (TPR) repeat protein